MKFVVCGKLLAGGIKLYNQGLYIEAKEKFNDAFVFNHEDFSVNFWLARVAALLNEKELARRHLSFCKQIKPGLTALIEPWEEYIEHANEAGIVSQDAIEQLNANTDRYLETCYRNMDYTLSNTLKVVALCILVPQVWAYHYAPRIGIVLAMISSIYITYRTLKYISSKTVLNLNLYFRYKIMVSDMKKLFKTKSFIYYTIFIIVGLYSPNLFHFVAGDSDWEGLKEAFTGNFSHNVLLMSPIYGIVLIPIMSTFEEILFRYVLYNYLVNYNKTLAYLLVAILFSLYHFGLVQPFYIFFSLLYTFYYDKYQTIIAPICIHILQNYVVYLLTYIYYSKFI